MAGPPYNAHTATVTSPASTVPRDASARSTLSDPGHASSPRLLLAWLGFALLLFHALFVGGSWLGLYAGGIRVLNLAAVSVGLVVWVVVAWRRPAWRPRSAVWPALVTPWAALAVSALASSNSRIGLEFVAWALLMVALYLLLVRVLALPYVRARIGGLLAAIALVTALAYLAWTLSLWVEWWELVGTLRLPPFRPTQLGLTWGSPSVLMAVQILMVSGAAGGLGLRTRGAKLTIAILLVLTAIMLVVSGSRSAWLSATGAAVLVAVAALLSGSRRASIVDRMRSGAGVTAMAVVVIVAVILALTWGPAMVDRLAGYGDGGRPTYWATALRMFVDAPLLGQGPGMWMPMRIAFTHAGEPDLYQPHAHNQYLQSAAELGLLGLAAGAVTLACLAWLIMRGARSDDARSRSWAWAAAFGLTYIALDTVVDVHTIPTVALLLGIPIAALDAIAPRVIGEPTVTAEAWRPVRRVGLLLLVIGCGVAVLFLARSESVAMTHGRAVSALMTGETDAAAAPAREAVAADPQIAAYQLTLALAAAGEGDWPIAEEAFGAAARLDGSPAAWLGLARAQAELRRSPTDVDASLRESLRLGAQQPAVTFAAAQVYDQAGLTAAADDAYARTVAAEPSLAGDLAWRARMGASRWDTILEAAAALAPDSAWEIALMSGDAATATELVDGHPAEAELIRLIAARGGDADAVREVQRAALEAPQDPSRLAWAARASVWDGDPEQARRFRRLIRLGPHYAPISADVRAGDPASDGALGTSTYYYGTYTYRRGTPPDLMPPGLAGLIVAE